MHEAILILGSNINPAENLDRALDLLREQVNLLEISSTWETGAVGTRGPNYLNAAARIATSLEAEQLKWQVLRSIETTLGRVRSSDKYAPRPIDLDVIIFDGVVVDDTLWERAYIALTVAELLPDFSHPQNGRRLADIAQDLHQHAYAVKVSKSDQTA